MRNIKFLLPVLFFALGCSSVKIKNKTEFANTSRKVAIVRIVAENDSIAHNGQKIGDFVLREDLNMTASNMHLKMDQAARSQGANLMVVHSIGYGKKGNGFYAEGSLYHVSGKIAEPNEEPCAVVFMRDDREAYSVSSFPINIVVNNRNYGDIKRNQFFKADIKNCNEKAVISVNNEQKSVDLMGRTRYFNVINKTETPIIPIVGPGGLMLFFGESKVNLVEIEDELIGRLIYRQRDN